MKLLWHELAETEHDEAIDYYLDHAGPVIARKFATEVSKALAMLKAQPGIGMETYRYARRIPLHGFPFNLVYRLLTDRIVVIAIANQSRRPGYWRRRH
jgi:plasmid stabilization system protein ParE